MSLDPATGIVSATQVNGQGGYQINALVTDSSFPAPNVASALLNFGVYTDDSYGGCPMFPPDSIYHQRIDLLPVDTNGSDQIPSAYLPAPLHPDFGYGFYPAPGGIPFMRVPANQPATNVILEGNGQIDSAGSYAWPLPPWPVALVEGTSFGQYGDDHHILIVQTGNDSIDAPQTGPCTLFETYQSIAVPDMYDAGSNTWSLGAGVHYHLASDEIASYLDYGAQDSAGIPIVPLLIRASEVPLGVQHPLRMSFPAPTDWFVWPGTGCCSDSGPPQGLLYRLKASVNWQAVCPVSSYPQAATVLQALQQYGAYMSDHGSPGYIQGVPDVRWDDYDLACIKQFHVSDLEVVDNSSLEYSSTSGLTVPYVVPAALPSGVVDAGYSEAISEVGGNPATLQWSLASGTLPPGLALDPVAGTIGGAPSSAAGSPFTFGITATDTGSRQTSLPQSFSIGVSTPGGPAPDLTISSTHAGNFTQGQTGASYSLTVTNSGSQPTNGAAAVNVTDTLPSGLTPTAIGGTGWSCTLAPLACTRGDVLPAGGSYAAVTVTAAVAGNAAPTLTNIATVSGGGETNTANDQATDPTTVIQLPDLVVSSTHTGNFNLGQMGATYSLAVTNIGGGMTSGAVTVTDSVPAGLTATAISGGGWTCSLGPPTCTRSDPLPTGAPQAVTVTVTVAGNAPASVTNIATVSGGGEINTSNDQATDPTSIVQLTVPDLTVSSTHTGNFVQGQTGAAYSITVTNSGGAPTVGAVTVTDTLPTGLTATAIGGTGWNCTLATLTCTRNDALASGGNYPVTVTVNVASNAAASITNTATVAGGGETNTANDQATDPTVIVQPPDLTVSGAHSDPFTQGQTGATYSIVVSNIGAGPTFGSVIVTDTLPPGLTATAIGGAGWNCTLATLTCTRGDVLSAGGTYPLTVTVTVAANAAPSVTNVVTVAGGSELNTSNDQAIDPTNIVQLTPIPSLTVSSNHTGSFTQGQTGATYTLTVSNGAAAGPTSGAVKVIDTLPAGMTATAIGGTGWNCTLAKLTCTESDVLNAGASYLAITVTVNVASNAAASVTNQVSVSGGGSAPASGSDATTVILLPILSAFVTADADTVAAGSSIGYTATVSNSGAAQTGTATAVTLSDSLPARTGMVWSISPPYSGPGTCTVSGPPGSQALGCSFGDMAAGAMASVHVTSTTSPTDCAVYTNTATVSASNSSSLQAGPATAAVQCPPLVVSGPSALPTGTAGVPYSAAVTASGGTGSYTWSAVGLPGELTIGHADGVISGTPAASGGPFNVQVKVTDSNSTTAAQNYSLLIASPCDVNQDGIINVLDVQTTIDEVLGFAPPVNELHRDSPVSAVDVQLVINAALGLGCPVGLN
jgi:uncharacterized repeat protein (TIGR01451 family)